MLLHILKMSLHQSRLCLVQISVFGTSVFAARHMAACDWPGFAAGGALWFLDLTKAAAIIHWGQVSLQAVTEHLGLEVTCHLPWTSPRPFDPTQGPSLQVSLHRGNLRYCSAHLD